MSKLSMNNPTLVKKLICVAMIIVLSLSLLFILKVKKENENSGYDVVYVIDNSGSISKDSAYAQARTKALSTITNMAQDSNMRIGVVFFGDLIENGDVLPLTKMDESGVLAVNAFLDKEHNARNYHTDIGEGLKCAQSLFKNSSRQNAIILFSDGIDDNDFSDPSKETKKQVAKLAKKEIPIYCVYYSGSNNDLAALRNIANYYGEAEYSDTRVLSTDEIMRAIDLKLLFDVANEKNVITKLNRKEFAGAVLFLGIMILFLFQLAIHKTKGCADGEAIKELKGLMGELETVQLLCNQEALKIKKLRRNMLWNSVFNQYDFSKVDSIIGEIQTSESLMHEAKMRVENGIKNKYTMSRETYQDLSLKMKQYIKLLEKNLDFLRKENIAVSSLVSKYS